MGPRTILDEMTHSLDLIARAALASYDLPEDAGVRLLNLSENATFELTSGERRLILRIHRAGYHTYQEIVSELAWTTALSEQTDLDTPVVVPTVDGQDILTMRSSPLPDERYCVAFEPIAGRELGLEDLLRWASRIGATTATLHAHARSWQPPSWFFRPAWDWHGILGDMPRWGRWQAHPTLEAGDRVLIERAALQIADRLADYRHRRRDCFGLIHADMRLANFLADGEALGVIDFDDCGPGFFLWDLATLFSLIEDDPRLPAAVHRWLDGYQTVGHLTSDDVSLIPSFIMLRRLQVLAWLVSHADTDLARSHAAPYLQITLEVADHYLADRLLPAVD